MGKVTVNGVSLLGIAAAVPESIRTFNQDAEVFDEADLVKIRDNIGVKQRHIVKGNTCTSDLCFEAAEQLIKDMEIDRATIDSLLFVSQTPDYLLPATSCSLHGRLGLKDTCAAFDVNLGCSGYIYAIWLASSLLKSKSANRIMVLAGDTISRISGPEDRSVALLFGDAGTATILERSDNALPMSFVLGTDGGGQNNLIVPAGGFRKPSTELTRQAVVREGGNIRSDENLFMNGPEIFSFTLKQVPAMFKSLTDDYEHIDAVVMHQANKFMLDYLAKRMKIPKEKNILALERYGNTSSASIPLAITTVLADQLRNTSMNLLLAGFGVGYSWGGVTLNSGPMVVSDLIMVQS